MLGPRDHTIEYQEAEVRQPMVASGGVEDGSHGLDQRLEAVVGAVEPDAAEHGVEQFKNLG